LIPIVRSFIFPRCREVCRSEKRSTPNALAVVLDGLEGGRVVRVRAHEHRRIVVVAKGVHQHVCRQLHVHTLLDG